MLKDIQHHINCSSIRAATSTTKMQLIDNNLPVGILVLIKLMLPHKNVIRTQVDWSKKFCLSKLIFYLHPALKKDIDRTNAFAFAQTKCITEVTKFSISISPKKLFRWNQEHLLLKPFHYGKMKKIADNNLEFRKEIQFLMKKIKTNPYLQRG